MKTPYITNIQKFSVFDGDGIRTTIFFKGCALDCAWCHNPESLSFKQDFLYDCERCSSCGKCIETCHNKALSFNENGSIEHNEERCDFCRECEEYCIKSAIQVAGRQYSPLELVKEIEKDRIFYDQSSGGVTFSGGECMLLDMEYLTDVMKRLKRKGYHIAVDTSGHAPEENYALVLPYVDVFLFDLKLMDEGRHREYVGQSNELIIENLLFLRDKGAKINIRLPIIGYVNEEKEDLEDVIDFLKENQVNPVQINLLPYHNIGIHKYAKLNMEYPEYNFVTPSDKTMEGLRQMFVTAGYANTKIGG